VYDSGTARRSLSLKEFVIVAKNFIVSKQLSSQNERIEIEYNNECGQNIYLICRHSLICITGELTIGINNFNLFYIVSIHVFALRNANE
jgi:hypothetical protein